MAEILILSKFHWLLLSNLFLKLWNCYIIFLGWLCCIIFMVLTAILWFHGRWEMRKWVNWVLRLWGMGRWGMTAVGGCRWDRVTGKDLVHSMRFKIRRLTAWTSNRRTCNLILRRRQRSLGNQMDRLDQTCEPIPLPRFSRLGPLTSQFLFSFWSQIIRTCNFIVIREYPLINLLLLPFLSLLFLIRL